MAKNYGLVDYEMGRAIYAQDYPFYALIQAAMRGADLENLEKLKEAWPELHAELQERYHAPGGRLERDKK